MSFPSLRLQNLQTALAGVGRAALLVMGVAGCTAIGSRLERTASGTLSGGTERRGARVTTAREDVLRWAQGTYIGRLLVERDSILDRWHPRVEAPIRVWIEDAPRGFTYHADEVRGAFSDWSGIGLPLRFRFVGRRDDAEVRVTWGRNLGRRTGNTVWRVDGAGWMRAGDVVLAPTFADGRALDERSVRAIALHEVGHVLGLSHSTDTHDIMAPLVRVTALSQSDRATARLLYTLPPGRVR